MERDRVYIGAMRSALRRNDGEWVVLTVLVFGWLTIFGMVVIGAIYGT